MRQSTLFLPTRPYGRGAVLVASESAPGVEYLVDFEGYETTPVVCTCDGFLLGGRPCTHMQSAALYI